MQSPSVFFPNPKRKSDKCVARRRSVPQKVYVPRKGSWKSAVERGTGKQGAQIKSTPLPAGHSSFLRFFIYVGGPSGNLSWALVGVICFLNFGPEFQKLANLSPPVG